MYLILIMALKVGPIFPCVIEEEIEVVEKLNILPKLAS